MGGSGDGGGVGLRARHHVVVTLGRLGCQKMGVSLTDK